MTPQRSTGKKEPKYLEEITFTTVDQSSLWNRANASYCSDLFLGRYNEKDLLHLLDKVGITAILHQKGYRNLVISIYRHEDFSSRLYVNFDSLDKETRIIELIVREGYFRPKQIFVEGYAFTEGLSILLIEWLALQDPRAAFSERRPRLPGQMYPGLGGLMNIQALLYRFARASEKDAIVDVPEHYHGAVIYSRKYSFFSPAEGGRIKAMMRDLNDRPLSDISFAIAFDCLRDRDTGQPLTWQPSEQVCPISSKVRQYVKSDPYKKILAESMQKHAYYIDWNRFDHLVAEGIKDEL